MSKLALLAMLLVPTFASSQLAERLPLREPPTIEVQTTTRKRYLRFDTTRAASDKICGKGCSEAVAFSGAGRFLLIPAAFLPKTVVGIFTVPYDLIASPFRDHPTERIATWTVAGRSSPNKQVHVKIDIQRFAGSPVSAGRTTLRTDAAGNYSAKFSAPILEGEKIALEVRSGTKWPFALESRLCCIDGLTLKRD